MEEQCDHRPHGDLPRRSSHVLSDDWENISPNLVAARRRSDMEVSQNKGTPI